MRERLVLCASRNRPRACSSCTARVNNCLTRWICASSAQSAERGQGVAIADAALFADLIASKKVVKPFDIEVDSGNAYFLTYPPQRREQRNIRRFEEWLVSVLRV